MRPETRLRAQARYKKENVERPSLRILTAIPGAPLDVLPMAVLLCVELADRHFLPGGVNAIVKVPLDFLHLFPGRDIIPLPAGVLSVATGLQEYTN